mmetsp:Transcript_7/g.14  ORF Transcript_7/g.14 Transcript_7/m.14 type:complete len:274 (-) Transcript_7:292-1113(-)
MISKRIDYPTSVLRPSSKDSSITQKTMKDKASKPLPDRVFMSSHPILSHKISLLRSSATSPANFRSTLREITFYLGYEATMRSLTTKPVALTVPMGKGDHVDYTGEQLAENVAIVPILRSGLGMVDPMLELLPSAGVHHIGMYKRGLMPVQYYNRLPKQCDFDVAFILDPVIATACTAISVVGILKKWGVEKIHLISAIASREGLDKITSLHPDIDITVGTVDTELTAEGTCLPGLGDAGDRLFGTPMIVDDEELMHPSKRRKNSIDDSTDSN